MIHLIEKMHKGHFEYLPKKLRFPVTQKYGVSIINCGLGSSMFNIAMGGLTQVTDQKILDIIAQFKQQPFAWWIPPSEKNIKLSSALLDHGFVQEVEEHAMLCDLQKVAPKPLNTTLDIQHVQDIKTLEDFTAILKVYDQSSEAFYQKLGGESFANFEEKLFVGYVNHTPASIAILFIQDNTSSVFSLITQESARGKGYGHDMMQFLMNKSKNLGCQYMTLSASSDAGYRIYERLGFQRFGAFECCEHLGEKT